MAKEKRETTGLTLELTKVDTLLSIGGQFVEKLPDGEAKRALTKMVDEGLAALARAHVHVLAITKLANSI